MRHLVWLQLRHIVASDDTYASAAIASQLTDHHPTLSLHSCPARHRPSPAWRTSRQGRGANPHDAPCSPISPLSCPAAVVADLQPCPDHHCRLGRPRRWRVVTIPRTPGLRPESPTSLQSSPHQTAWEAIRRVGTLPVTSFLEGVPVHLVANRLGHSDPAVTLRLHAHVLRESASGVAGRLSGLLLANLLANRSSESMKPAGQGSDLRVCGGQGRGRTADLPIFSWRTDRLVRQGQTTSGTSRARKGLACRDPGNVSAIHDVSVRDQSVTRTRRVR